MVITRGALTVPVVARLAVPCLLQIQAKLLRFDWNTHTLGGNPFAISGALEGNAAVAGF